MIPSIRNPLYTVTQIDMLTVCVCTRSQSSLNSIPAEGDGPRVISIIRLRIKPVATTDKYLFWARYHICVLVGQSSDSLQPHGLWPPGSSVLGISQAWILEGVAISFSRGSSQLRDWIHISCTGRSILYCLATREAPHLWWGCCNLKES